jgi:cytosine/adenosine deaminase-related metal-dependent hydrolase
MPPALAIGLAPGLRPKGRTLLRARWIVGHEAGSHRLIENGELVFEGDRILFVGRGFPGEVARRIDLGGQLVGPGFIDLDALADLDTGILGFDNGPAWKKGRVWPRTYLERGPYEMYDPGELAFQKRYAFAQLVRNGITTALPIASPFYRAWAETPEEFEDAAAIAAEIGLRVYLGPSYRSGLPVVEPDGTISLAFDETRGLTGLDAAIAFCESHEGRHGGLVRTMLAPDRIEFSTEALLRRSAQAARDLGVPIRLHCCQSDFEVATMRRRFGATAPVWLDRIGALSDRLLLPHGTHVQDGDLDLIRDAGAVLVHCPLVMARHGAVLRSFSRARRGGMRIALGTDTWPADMILNMQVGILLNRTVEADMTCVRAEEFYDAATLGGAEALGRPDLGRLAPGAKADFAVVNLTGERIGLTIDPIQTLMIGASGRDVSSVVIDGRVVMADGVIAGFDPEEAMRRAQAQFDRLVARYPERTYQHPPVEDIFPPAYPRV